MIKSFHLGINTSGKLELRYPGKNREYSRIINSVDNLEAFLEKKRVEFVLCASSMDFPHEYTKDKSVIEMCRQIRSK